MSSFKMNSLAKALVIACSAMTLGACSTVGNTWDYFTDDNDSSLRTPTGYYEHSNASEYIDPLKVPAGLDQPVKDNVFNIPEVNASNDARVMVGENMDVRPPVVSHVNELGAEISNFNDKDAVVWFLPYSNIGIHTEEQAWNMLHVALNYLNIPVESSDPSDLVLVTSPVDFNQFGDPYDAISEDLGNLRYRQSYRVEIGRASGYGVGNNTMDAGNATDVALAGSGNAYQGQVGYQISLVNSNTMESDGSGIADRLTPRQERNFTVGFANSIVKALSLQNQVADVLPDELSVVLGRDNNDQDALIIAAPYNAMWSVMHGVLSQYGFEVIEYSISGSYYKVVYDEEPARYYREVGVKPMNIEDEDYIIRLAVNANNQTVVTFNNVDDKPLRGDIVAALYDGFSQALAREYALYKGDPKAYIAQFVEED